MIQPPVNRPSRPSLSIRGRLRLAAMLVAAVITTLAFLRARERRAAEEQRITAQSEAAAATIARSLDATIIDAHALLNSLGRLLDPAAPAAGNDALLRALLAESPVRYANIYLADSVGGILSAVRLRPAGREAARSSAPREYVLEAARTKRFAAGAPVHSRLQAGAPWVLPFIKPIIDSTSGSIRALVGASIFLDSLDAMFITRALPSGSIVSVIDSSDRIVLRSLDADAWIGKPFPQKIDATQRQLALPFGTRVRSPIDSIQRAFGTHSLTQMPWRVYVGIPTAYAFGPSRTQFTEDVILGVLFSLAVVTMGYWIVARFVLPIESLTRDALAISTGDMARRSTIDSSDEVGTLARTFNAMADAIVERNAALASTQVQLQQVQKLEALGSFAGGVAHDFNNYLSSIIGHSEMALSDLPVDSPVRIDVDGVLASAKRAAELTRQILVFSRQQTMAPQVLDPNDVIADIERMIARLLGESIALTLTLEPAVGVVRADRGQLEQVLMNLAANARDAMPSGGRLQITTAGVDLPDHHTDTPSLAAGRYLRLSVSDTGTGISPDILDRMFEPFFTTKERGHGTGLGLALAHGIVQQSGGTMHAESAEGHGTTFHIYLPLEQAPATGATPVSTASVAPLTLASGSEQILLVEDDHAVATATTRMLTRAGYEVARAEDGQAGLDALAGAVRPYDLVITDIVMPGMSGADLAREIAVRYPMVKVLLISGYPDDDELVRDVARYALPFLAKPFSMADLLQTVRRLLDAERHATTILPERS